MQRIGSSRRSSPRRRVGVGATAGGAPPGAQAHAAVRPRGARVGRLRRRRLAPSDPPLRPRKRRLDGLRRQRRQGRRATAGLRRRARLTEPTELVLDRSGNLYFSDVNQGRVRRIDRRGMISTVARVPAAAGLSIDPSGRYLAIASIEGWVYRLALSVRARSSGWPATAPTPSSGDGGPAVAAELSGPHDVTYDARGNLLIAELSDVRRDRCRDRADRHALPRVPAFKVVPARADVLPPGRRSRTAARSRRSTRSARFCRVIGTGPAGPARRPRGDRPRRLPPERRRARSGAILIAETRPVPAIRRLAPGGRTLTTLLR